MDRPLAASRASRCSPRCCITGVRRALRVRASPTCNDNPGRYQNHTVSINGIVTTSAGACRSCRSSSTRSTTAPARSRCCRSAAALPTQRRARAGARARRRGRRARRPGARPASQEEASTSSGKSICEIDSRHQIDLIQAVIFTATAVMSSFGGASPRNSCTAVEDRVDDLARRLVARCSSTTSSSRVGAELAPQRVVRFEDAVRCRTRTRRPAADRSVTSS